MDKLIPKSKRRKKYLHLSAIICLTLLLLYFIRAYSLEHFKTARVNKNDIKRYTVVKKELTASFSTDGKVIPLQSYQVETPVGGKVEKICKKIGDYVTQGEPIAVLSNDDLQLQLINSETEVANQINNLSTARIQRNQSSLSQRRNLFALKMQMTKKEREIRHIKSMYDKKYISEDEYLSQMEEYDTLKNNYQLSSEEAITDSLMREQQVIQIEQSLSQVKKNLDQIKNKIHDLVIKAPISGQITNLDLTMGKILSLGSQIAIIENNEQYYIQAKINQYYLKHLKTGSKAKLTDFNPEVLIEIDNIHPKLEGDNVTVDFKGKLPENIKSGQIVNIDMLTSTIPNTLVIPLGEYLNENDNREVFVIDQTGKRAFRRKIETGRRNIKEIEIISGLDENEEIIISSNPEWKKKESLKIR